jgi:mannose-1-phosphate guanylyltransferase
VVLAGGDGVRLQALTHLISGEPRPKQFCNFFGGKSLLAHTRERIAPIFDEERTLFALTRVHERYHGSELLGVNQRHRIVQPANRGTALAMAVCLQAIAREDADALVAFFPSDHHYVNTPAFQTSIAVGLRAAEQYPHCLLVLGAKPTYPEVEYGWIQPGRTLVESSTNPLQRVSRFWEKPTLRQAEAFVARGCLWNTFVTLGMARTFLDICRATVPQLARLLDVGSLDGRLDEIYGAVPLCDFSRAVLSRVPRRLLVLQDTMSGWTDLGSPSRVIELLTHDAVQPAWLLRQQTAGDGALVEYTEARQWDGRKAQI